MPVNSDNFRNPRSDDIMVTLAGPWMNLLLAIVLMGLARLGYMLHSSGMVEVCLNTSRLSLLLCFFNLLPIPPLDGSQVVRAAIGMSYETYHQIARYGMFILILVLQVPLVPQILYTWTTTSGSPLRAGSACPWPTSMEGERLLASPDLFPLSEVTGLTRTLALPGWVTNTLSFPLTQALGIPGQESLIQTSYTNTLTRH